MLKKILIPFFALLLTLVSCQQNGTGLDDIWPLYSIKNSWLKNPDYFKDNYQFIVRTSFYVHHKFLYPEEFAALKSVTIKICFAGAIVKSKNERCHFYDSSRMTTHIQWFANPSEHLIHYDFLIDDESLKKYGLPDRTISEKPSVTIFMQFAHVELSAYARLKEGFVTQIFVAHDADKDSTGVVIFKVSPEQWEPIVFR